MVRYCPNCNQWDLNFNLSTDPIRGWRAATHDEVLTQTNKWIKEGKYL